MKRVSMAEVSGAGVHFSYETAGDGFPLILAPGPQGVWSPYIPLWVSCAGQSCIQVMTWRRSPAEGLHPSARAAQMLGTFLDLLSLERVYLASQTVSWHMALHFALHCLGAWRV